MKRLRVCGLARQLLCALSVNDIRAAAGLIEELRASDQELHDLELQAFDTPTIYRRLRSVT